MPLLFSYGTLRRDDVQLATYGRKLVGDDDELPGHRPALVPIPEPEVAAALGRTHHANAAFSGDPADHVAGMAFEVTDAELASTDAYEAPFGYRRTQVTLASGRQAWVYVYAGPPT